MAVVVDEKFLEGEVNRLNTLFSTNQNKLNNNVAQQQKLTEENEKIRDAMLIIQGEMQGYIKLLKEQYRDPPSTKDGD